ncbi:unnamed protein product [Auanema sp. JU1783]|nr:unnamed protein product [Auanema sp. JU1783]
MTFTCAISGEQANEPVVTPSGHIFEKRLIIKYLNENGTDPITSEKLSEEELIDLKIDSTSAAVRNTSQTSIPSLLKQLQDEWDAVMLNSYSLRSQLQVARQELSHSLYQHDAACRVIARLSKELTAAREALSTLKPHGSGHDVSHGDVDMEQSVEENQIGLSSAVIKKLDDKASGLTAIRKQRGKSAPENLAKPDDITNFKQINSHNAIHSTGNPGITAMDIKGSTAITGGVDKKVIMFNINKETVENEFIGHTKKITSVILHPNGNNAVSASSDATVRVWTSGDQNNTAVVDVHQAAVTDISLHATGDYILSASDDSHWAFSDLHTGKTLCKVANDETSNVGICCAEFHPDGLIFGTGTADAVVKIWDMKEQKNVANFPGHSAPVRAIAFSENGYYLATGADDGEVRLWDLRKLKMLKNLILHDGKASVNNIHFDNSGTFLGVASSDVQVLHVKPWQVVGTFSESTSNVTSVRFGENANTIYSSSLDKSLRIYSL